MWRSLSLIEVIYFAFRYLCILDFSAVGKTCLQVWINLHNSGLIRTCRRGLFLKRGDYFWEARTKYFGKSFVSFILIRNRTFQTFQTPPTSRLFEKRLAHRLQHHYSHPLIHPTVPNSFASWTSCFPFPSYFNNSASSLHIFVLFISPRTALLGSLNRRRFVLCRSAENLSDEKSECVTFGKWKIVVKTSEESRKKILH